MILKVMSYNIMGHGAERSALHLERIAAVIRELDPDVVGLQEVHCRTKRSPGIDQAEELGLRTSMKVAFGKSCSMSGGDYGNAILSKCDVRDVAIDLLPGSGERRSLMRASVDLGGRDLRFYVTHLTAWGAFKRAERMAQIDAVRAVIDAEAGPFVIAGDLNTTPRTPEIARLLECESLQECGTVKMVTHRFTRSCFDYIFAGRGARAVSAEAIRKGPSDHWPVIAEVEVV